MTNSNEAPDPELALAQQMLAELEAGAAENSQSEPVAGDKPSEIAEPEKTPQADDDEAPKNEDNPTDDAPTPKDGDEDVEETPGLDLDWIDQEDSDYAELLATLHENGTLDDEAIQTAKAAYAGRNGMRKAFSKANVAEKALEKLRPLEGLFDNDKDRADFLAWKESKESAPSEPKGPDLSGLKERMKAAETDEELFEIVMEGAAEIASHTTQTAKATDQAHHNALVEYADTLESWGEDLSKDLVDELGAEPDDVFEASKIVGANYKRDGIDVTTVIRSKQDLRDRVVDIVQNRIRERQIDSLLGKKAEREKKYNGRTLKASSTPPVPSEVEHDESTQEGRYAALKADPELQRLMEQVDLS